MQRTCTFLLLKQAPVNKEVKIFRTFLQQKLWTTLLVLELEPQLGQNGKAPQHWSPGFRSKTGTVTLNNVKTELEKKRYFKDLKHFFSP